MTLPTVLAAAFAFSIGIKFSDYLLINIEQFVRGFIIAIVNRRAAALRLHSFHCKHCCKPIDDYICFNCNCFYKANKDGIEQIDNPYGMK